MSNVLGRRRKRKKSNEEALWLRQERLKTPKLVNNLNQKKPKVTIFAAKRTYLAIGLIWMANRIFSITVSFKKVFQNR